MTVTDQRFEWNGAPRRPVDASRARLNLLLRAAHNLSEATPGVLRAVRAAALAPLGSGDKRDIRVLAAFLASMRREGLLARLAWEAPLEEVAAAFDSLLERRGHPAAAMRESGRLRAHAQWSGAPHRSLNAVAAPLDRMARGVGRRLFFVDDGGAWAHILLASPVAATRWTGVDIRACCRFYDSVPAAPRVTSALSKARVARATSA